MNKAKVHSIQTMGTLDGPGIRYVLFLQGCPFRCLFCHNPDTWEGVNGEKRDLKELVEDVLKYKDFFKTTDGGVTVSGGEPLLQIPFLTEFFKKLKEHDIHTAIDTCGHVEINSKLDDLMKYTDLVMLDIKHLDRDKHVKLTGQPNDKVLKFLDYINSINKTIWIRQVLTPSYTMDDEYISMLIEFLKRYNIAHVELLPYHDMAKGKYEKLGISYPLKDIPVPSKEDVAAIRSKFIEHGFDVV